MNKKTGAVFLARQLEAYGVSHVFMVPAILRRTLVEMEMLTSINRLHVHSEKTAVYMADGFARASGRPAICMAQVIGALNIAAGLREPFLANSPVIALQVDGYLKRNLSMYIKRWTMSLHLNRLLNLMLLLMM